MPRLPVVLAVCALAMVLGWVTVRVLGNGRPGSRQGTAVAPTASGQRPGFHVWGTEEDRQAAFRKAIADLTSGQPQEIGALKDDLALLCDDPAVVRAILEHYNRRARLTRYEAAGFADIFALVKNPAFVAPLKNLFQHEEWIVRRNSIDAAVTQADPELTPALDREYQWVLREFEGKGGQSRLGILHAAAACGGDHFPVVLDRAFADPEATVRGGALEIVIDRKLDTLLSRVRAAVDDPDSGVRLRARWALAVLGQRDAVPQLLGFLDPRNPAESLLAVQAVTTVPVPEAAAEIRRLLQDATADVRPAFIVALVLLGDPAIVPELEAALDEERAPPERVAEALAGLAAAGSDRHLPRLRREARIGGFRTGGILRGLAASARVPDPELLEAVLDNETVTHPAMVEAVVPRAGDGLVSFLAGRLREARTDNRAAFLLGCLRLLGSEAARNAIIAAHDQWPNLVEQCVRLMDLERRRQGR